MSKTALGLIGVALFVAGAFLAGTCLRSADVSAQTGGAAGDMIAVTVQDNAMFPTLFVIDAKTRNLAMYRGDPSAGRLRFAGARNIEWDLRIPTEYPPRTGPGTTNDPSVVKIRDAVIEDMKRREKEPNK